MTLQAPDAVAPDMQSLICVSRELFEKDKDYSALHTIAFTTITTTLEPALAALQPLFASYSIGLERLEIVARLSLLIDGLVGNFLCRMFSLSFALQFFREIGYIQIFVISFKARINIVPTSLILKLISKRKVLMPLSLYHKLPFKCYTNDYELYESILQFL